MCPFTSLDDVPQAPGAVPHLASHAWVAHPTEGRFLVFPGNLLHGVLPNGGPALHAVERGGPGGDDNDKGDGGFRTTLVIAWWAAGVGPVPEAGMASETSTYGASIMQEEAAVQQIESSNRTELLSHPAGEAGSCTMSDLARLPRQGLKPSMKAPRPARFGQMGGQGGGAADVECCHGEMEGSSSGTMTWPEYFSVTEEDRNALLAKTVVKPGRKPSAHTAHLVAPAWQSITQESNALPWPTSSPQSDEASQVSGAGGSMPLLSTITLPSLHFFIWSEDEFDRLYLSCPHIA